MADTHKLGFGPIASPSGGVLVVFADDSLNFGPKTRALLGAAADLVARAAKTERFTGKERQRARHRGAGGRPQGDAADRASEPARPGQDPRQAAGLREARRRRHGAHSGSRQRGRGGAGTRRRAAEAGCGGRCRARRDAARLFVRPLQDQAQGGRRGAGQGARHARRRGRGRRAQGLGRPPGGRRRRHHGARPRQRAAERSFPIEFARRASDLAQARRRRRGARRQGDDQARHGRAARRRPGLAAGQPHRRDALERRQEGNGAARLHRQGRVLRHRRHLDQAGRRHGGHEGRHGGRGLRGRADACARRPQGQGQRDRRDRPGREHAGRQCAAPGRHRHLDVGPDHRDHQYRRRGAPRARRRLPLRQHALQAEIHDRSGDADRRDHGRARPGARRPVLQRRQAVRAADARPGSRPARRCGACRSAPNTTS